MLIEKGFIDKDNIGVQGHSWGGYQIAYLVTKTDIFKAAESGAPVPNMISAYGGIRWWTGLSRQFQYEHTQSRIGGTPWEYPQRYIENSPIFNIDKINTPLLINAQRCRRSRTMVPRHRVFCESQTIRKTILVLEL